MSSRLPPRSRKARSREPWQGVSAAQLLPQRREAASAALGRFVRELRERDHRLRGVGERTDVGGDAVLEVVRLLHEGNGLDAVGEAHGDPQVPLLHLQLGPSDHVELHGRDAEALGLAPRCAVGRGIRDDELHLPAARGAVIAQQVVHVALQEHHLGGERARGKQLDRHQVGQRPEDVARGPGQGERPAGGEVEAAADVPPEQVHHDGRRGEEGRAEAQAPERLAARRELAREQREVGEHQKQRGQRHEIDGVAQVDHAAGDPGEVRQHAERGRDRAEAGREAHDERIVPDEDQHEGHRGGHDEGGDLVARDARRPHAHGREPRHEEGRAQVLRDQDPHLELRAEREAEQQKQHLARVLPDE